MHWSQGEISSPHITADLHVPAHTTREITLQRLRQSNTTILPWPTPSTTTRSTHTLTQHWTKTGLRLHKGDATMTRNSRAFPSLGPRLGVCCDPSHGTVTRGEHLSLSVWKMWHAPFMWKGRNTSLLQTRGSSESLFNVGKTHEWLVLCLISRWTTKGKHARTHTRGHKGCIQTILC